MYAELDTPLPSRDARHLVVTTLRTWSLVARGVVLVGVAREDATEEDEAADDGRGRRMPRISNWASLRVLGAGVNQWMEQSMDE
jgi:hypothetical protein